MNFAQIISNQPVALNPASAVTFEREGQTINASYQTVMLWSDQERAAIGVYPIVDDAIEPVCHRLLLSVVRPEHYCLAGGVYRLPLAVKADSESGVESDGLVGDDLCVSHITHVSCR